MNRAGRLRYLATAALVAAAASVGVLLRSYLAAPDLVMLFLLATVVCAAAFGRGPALLASGLSVLGYDFFFVPPFHTLAVADQRNLLTFATLFVVGLLISELTSRIRAQEDAAAEDAERLRIERSRSTLLSSLSHDLRTPLAAITGAATTLRDEEVLGAQERRELVEAICEEAVRLERFVAKMLEMTRLESGALEVKREWVTLEELVGAALTRLETQLEGRPVKTALPGGLPLISVDPVLLEQVLLNLLDNAIRHTPPGTAIELSATSSPGLLVIELADRGPGLGAGNQDKVFEKFFRGASGDGRGSGLGLAICRGIVEAHGGRISARNREEGGAVFRIELPLTGEAPDVPVEDELKEPRLG